MKKVVGFFIFVAIVGIAAYHALMYYDNNFRYGRMRETPAVRPHEEPLLTMDSGSVPIHGGDALYRVTPGKDLTAPVNMQDPAVIARGQTLYLIYCAQCHGKNYDGQGTVGQSFHPLPTNLRSPEVQSKPAGELFKSVSYGIPNGRQPPLATTIASHDRWHIIAFVRQLGTSP
jgi:mono/diheme cytochrome c family protein